MINKVIVLTGPTAIGKTNISLDIAKIYNCEIINADASQFRRGLNIGTAKIDLKNTSIPHHLIDIIDINDQFSIKDYQNLARMKINKLHIEGKLPLLVGGSGLYINATIGNYELDNKERDYLEEEKYSNYSNLELHNILIQLDYESSKKIHPNNRRRVYRAIQAAEEGSKISNLKSGNEIIYDSLIICLNTDRNILYERINSRFDLMIEAGWLDEVKQLKSKNINLDNIKDIGYKELNQYLDNMITFSEAKEIIQKKTRNYAKRQITWFKNKMNCEFINIDYDNYEATLIEIRKLIDSFLKL